jgi:aerotolerance regulator-like protein
VPFFSFANAALLWGAGLISVPIIIHLLNRRRFIVVEWAAMEWLLLAVKQNKRRITIEQLILLALRCLIILLLVCALSQMRFEGGAGGMLPGSNTDWVVVLDDSFTSGQAGSAGVCYDTAKGEVKELLKKVLNAGSEDSFTVTVSGKIGRKLIGVEKVDREAVDRVGRRIDHCAPSDVTHSPIALLEHGLSVLRKKTNANKALVLFSDCRLADWKLNEPQTEALKKLLKDVETLGARVYIVDVGPTDGRDFGNVAVVKLEPAKKSVQVGAVEEFIATIRNFGPDPVKNVALTFTVTSPGIGPRTLPTRTIKNIPTGEAIEESLSYQFKTTGSYAMTVEIGGDPLPADNTRHLSFKATRGIPVLLVDGETQVDRTESETYTLRVALRPRRDSTFGIDPRVVGAEAFNPGLIEKAKVVFLANVAEIKPDTHKALLEFVKEGGGLVLFLGDQVDPVTFNRVFFDEGKGVAPCALDRAVGDPADATRTDGKAKFVRFSSEYMDHPVMAVFPKELAVVITGARFYRHFRLRMPGDMKAAKLNVVARFSDPDRTPAMVEREIGKGRVILVTTSADREWGNWPSTLTYPVLMKSLVEHLYTPGLGGRNLIAGSRYTRKVDLSYYDSTVSIEPPKEVVPLKRAVQGDESGATSVTVKQTAAAGVYTVKLKRSEGDTGAGGTDVEYFTANVDATHSDLRRPADLQRFESQLNSMGITYGKSAGDIWKDAPEERINLWFYVLILLGLCLAVESFLGWKFGHHAK